MYVSESENCPLYDGTNVAESFISGLFIFLDYGWTKEQKAHQEYEWPEA